MRTAAARAAAAAVVVAALVAAAAAPVAGSSCSSSSSRVSKSSSPCDGVSGRPLDYAVTGVVTLGGLLLIAGNCVLFKHRGYAPIRNKGVSPTLTILSSAGGLIWIAATIVVFNHFERNHRPLKVCSLWTFWMQACFGFSLWLNCLTVRLFQLHHVLILRRSLPKRWRQLRMTVAPLIVSLLPTIVVSVCASVSGAVKRVGPPVYCSIKKRVFAVVLLVLLPSYFMLFIWFAFRLRNTMSQWNEFRHIRIGGIMSFFLFLLTVVNIITKSYTSLLGRCFVTLTVAAAVFYYFWARNWEVIYNVLFHRQRYLEQFGEELNRINQRSASTLRSRQPAISPMDDCAIQMTAAAREQQLKLASLRNEVKRLQEEVARMDGSTVPM